MSAKRKAQRAEWQTFLLTVACGLWPVASLFAQALPPASGTPGVAGEMRTVSGRVLSGSSDSLRPVASQVVVLHRISADSSGPVDSVRTSAGGTYRFRYRLEGPRSMYIVSSRYAGVAYFTTPLREAAVTSPDADISVYDTTSVPFPLTLRARHVVIAPAEAGGVRRVVDVFEVANDSNRTLIAGSDGWTWRLVLPPEARDPAASGDLPPEAFRFTGGQAELLIPFPPGSRQLVLTYTVPARGSVSMPIGDATQNLEVLLEGAGGGISGAGLTAEDPVSMEGRTFQRFTASPVDGGTSFVVRGSGGAGNAGRIALLAVAVVAVALGILVGRRTPARAPAGAARPAAEALAREIAALDHVYSAPARRAGAGDEYYRSRRAALLDRLTETLPVEDRVTPT